MMKNVLFKLCLVAFIICGSAQNSPAQQPAGFSETLQIHMDAIRNRKLKELLATVDDNVILILPDGTRMNSKKEFEQLHIGWFAETNWKMEMTILKKEVSEDIGHVLIRYKYTEEGSVTVVRHTYLSMLFRKKSEQWLLIHDQNTRIEEP
jgi:ketosteroid isomerase-like protein